jgi:hypothetical protein
MAARAGVKTADPGGFTRRLRRTRRTCLAIAGFSILAGDAKCNCRAGISFRGRAQLGVSRAFRFFYDRNFLDSVSHFFT